VRVVLVQLVEVVEQRPGGVVLAHHADGQVGVLEQHHAVGEGSDGRRVDDDVVEAGLYRVDQVLHAGRNQQFGGVGRHFARLHVEQVVALGAQDDLVDGGFARQVVAQPGESFGFQVVVAVGLAHVGVDEQVFLPDSESTKARYLEQYVLPSRLMDDTNRSTLAASLAAFSSLSMK
jgi:hypothetical protein